MNFYAPQYIAWFLNSKFEGKNELDKDIERIVKQLGDFDLLPKDVKYEEREDGWKECSFCPKNDKYSMCIESVKMVSAPEKYDGYYVEIVAHFFDHPNSKIVIRQPMYEENFTMNILVDENDNSFSGLYLYDSYTFRRYDFRYYGQILYYDHDTVKFLRDQFGFEPKTTEFLSNVTCKELERLGLNYVYAGMEDNKNSMLGLKNALPVLLHNFDYETFEKFVKAHTLSCDKEGDNTEFPAFFGRAGGGLGMK